MDTSSLWSSVQQDYQGSARVGCANDGRSSETGTVITIPTNSSKLGTVTEQIGRHKDVTLSDSAEASESQWNYSLAPRLCSPSPVRLVKPFSAATTPDVTPAKQRQQLHFSEADASPVYSYEVSGDVPAVVSSDSCGDSNWASPLEVQQIRAACETLSRNFKQQLYKLSQELQVARQDCHAHVMELNRIKKLKKSYLESKRAFEIARDEKKAWEAERAMLEVQLQSLALENERLRMEVRKRGKALVQFQSYTANTMSVPQDCELAKRAKMISRSISTAPGKPSLGAAQASSRPCHEQDDCVTAPSMNAGGRIDRGGSYAVSLQHLKAHSQPPRGADPQSDARRLDHTLPLTKESTDEGVKWELKLTQSQTDVALAAAEKMRLEPESSDSLPTPSTSVPSSANALNPTQFCSGNTSSASNITKTADSVSYEKNSQEKQSSTPTYAKKVSSLTLDTTIPTQDRGLGPSAVNESANAATLRETQSSSLLAQAPNLAEPSSSSKDRTNTAVGTTTESIMTNVSSMPFLYHIPQTPAEALKEEIRLIEKIQQLEQENALLGERLRHLSSNHESTTERLNEQVIVCAHENAALKRQLRAAHDTCEGLRSEVHSLSRQVNDIRAATHEVENELSETKQKHMESLNSINTLHSENIDKLKKEHAGEVARLRREMDAAAVQADRLCAAIQSELSACLEKADREGAENLRVMEQYERRLEDLQRAQRNLQQALEEADREHTALKEHGSNETASLKQALDKAQEELSRCLLRQEELIEKIRRQDELIQSREGALRTMDQRFAEVTHQLAVARKSEEELLPWRLRAEELETELREEKGCAEVQVNLLRSAMGALQRKHKRQLSVLEKRLGESKCRLLGLEQDVLLTPPASSKSHCCSVGRQKHCAKGSTAGLDDLSGAEASPGRGDLEKKENSVVRMLKDSGVSSCDTLDMLRGSAAAAAALAGSIKRLV